MHLRIALFVLLSIAVLCFGSCAPPADDLGVVTEEAPASEEGVPVADTERVQAGSDEEFFGDSFRGSQNGTVYTDLDTYDVRRISFDTGYGVASSDALAGYYLNTRYELQIKYIDRIRIIDKITLSEALTVPHRYDMVEQEDLDYIFRTELRKTDGERIEYIIRINRISGRLQEGGGFNLMGDELKTLRRISFY